VFPCPSYYAAKLAAVGKVALGGRTSRSIVDSPNVLRAPTAPYRIGVPYWEPGDGLIELPVQVTRIGRLPVIGTALTLAGSTGARLLARLCVGAPLVNLELHGIDLLDTTDGLSALRGHQPDVSVSLRSKLDALRSFFAVLRTAGYEGVTLQTATARLFA
jgi:peptidoglycan-N-acetylglucosamine deacetylase